MSILNTHTEKELLQLASQGDEKSFISLFHLHKHKLYTFIIRITESPEITEDIIQDIFLKLWNDRQSLNSIDNLGGYIYRMGQNQAINLFKRMAKETVILAELQKQTTFSSGGAEENLALKDIHKRVAEVLELLSPKQKLIYTMSREDGMKYEEIAQRLNISPSTVKNHMIQALRSIRERLSHINPLAAGCLFEILQALKNN